MWTFQEGILLNTDDVVDPRDDRLLAIRNNVQFARLVDREGLTTAPITCFRGQATLLDITGRATLLACDLAGLLTRALQPGDPEDEDNVDYGVKLPVISALVPQIQDLLVQLYETGLVGVAADSPLDVLEAAKARGITKMAPVDYCVNAILGALRVALPDGTTDGTVDGVAIPDLLNERRSALLSALVDRYGWKMVLLTKPTRGRWSPDLPNDASQGQGDWLSLFQSEWRTAWQFSSLGIFITSNVGRRTYRTAPPSLVPPAPGVGHIVPDNISLTEPVPYTDNVRTYPAADSRILPKKGKES